LIGEVKNNPFIKIPVFGNGDIDSPQKAVEMKDRYNVDGIMIGRASIGNPWIFSHIKEYLNKGTLLTDPDIKERVSICKKHLMLSIELKGERTGVLEMRKHFNGYFKGIKNFKPYKQALLQTYSFAETEDILNKIEEVFSK